MNDRDLRSIVAGALLPFLPIGLAALYGGIPLAFYRVSMLIPLHRYMPAWMAPATLVLGSLGLLIVVLGGRRLRDLILGASMIIVVLEVFVALLILRAAAGRGVGLRMPLASLLLAERSLWLVLLLPLILVLPAAAFIYYWGRRGDGQGGGGEAFSVILLAASLLAAWFSVLIPHLPAVNPSGIPVATDTRFNAEWLHLMDRMGLEQGLRELAPKMRPLYLVFIYAVHRAAPWIEPRALMDAVVPGAGLMLLALTTYLLAGRSGARPGFTALLSVLYWAPMFVYGGFQTNLYALPMALTLFYLIHRGETRASMIIAAVLGLWHPWSLAYVSVAAAPMMLARRTWRPLKPLLAAWIISLAVDLYLLGGLKHPAFNLVRPAEPSYPDPLFALYIYVWGTLARPEILGPAAYELARGGDSWDRWMAAAGFLGFIPLRPPVAYRVLMQAPAPLLAGRLGCRYAAAAILAASTASWLFLLLVSPPLY